MLVSRVRRKGRGRTDRKSRELRDEYVVAPASSQVISAVPVSRAPVHVPVVVKESGRAPAVVVPQHASVHDIVKHNALISRGLNKIGLKKLGGIAAQFGYGLKPKKKKKKRPSRRV